MIMNNNNSLPIEIYVRNNNVIIITLPIVNTISVITTPSDFIIFSCSQRILLRFWNSGFSVAVR